MPFLNDLTLPNAISCGTHPQPILTGIDFHPANPLIYPLGIHRISDLS